MVAAWLHPEYIAHACTHLQTWRCRSTQHLAMPQGLGTGHRDSLQNRRRRQRPLCVRGVPRGLRAKQSFFSLPRCPPESRVVTLVTVAVALRGGLVEPSRPPPTPLSKRIALPSPPPDPYILVWPPLHCCHPHYRQTVVAGGGSGRGGGQALMERAAMLVARNGKAAGAPSAIRNGSPPTAKRDPKVSPAMGGGGVKGGRTRSRSVGPPEICLRMRRHATDPLCLEGGGGVMDVMPFVVVGCRAVVAQRGCYALIPSRTHLSSS